MPPKGESASSSQAATAPGAENPRSFLYPRSKLTEPSRPHVETKPKVEPASSPEFLVDAREIDKTDTAKKRSVEVPESPEAREKKKKKNKEKRRTRSRSRRRD